MSQELPTALVEAARRLARRGRPCTASALAREAGLSRATLYRLFPRGAGLREALAAAGVEAPGPAEARRARVFAATREVLTREGFDRLTVEAVAARARVGAATLYRWFGDREGLVRAFIEQASPRRQARAVAAAPGQPLEALAAIAAAALSALAENGFLMRMALAAPPSARKGLERLRAPAQGTEAALTALLARYAAQGLLRPGLEPASLARCFLGMVLVEAGVFGDVPPPADPAARGQALARLFWQGAGGGR